MSSLSEPQVLKIEETSASKTHVCDLCGKGSFALQDLRLGYVRYAHESCLRIGSKAISLFFELIVTHTNGTNILAEELLKARGAKFDLNDLFKEK